MHTREYITLLVESLEKKEILLDQIIEKNKVQRLLLLEDIMDPDQFEENLDGKSQLIEDLNRLDEGFELLYQRVGQALKTDRGLYAPQISRMQELITRITEKGTTVRVQEQRNRELAEQRFSDTRQKIRQVKVSNQAASQYYKNMTRQNVVEPQFMDRKK